MFTYGLRKRIAIVGSNGFLGRALSYQLKDFSKQIILCSRDKILKGENNFYVDIFDKNSWEHMLKNSRPEIVICTAWETEPNEYWTKTNNFKYMKYTLEFAKACYQNGVKQFIGIGTCSEFGLAPGKCNSLKTKLNPQDPYSESKVLTSVKLLKVAEDFAVKANWIRLFQPYGPNESTFRLIPNVINSIKYDKNLIINYPENLLDFIHIYDTADAIIVSMLIDLPYAINVGSGSATSLKEVTEKIARLLKSESRLKSILSSNRKIERYAYVDIENEDIFKYWKPKISLDKGLASIVSIS